MKPAPPPRSSTNFGQHASHEHSLLRLAGHLPGSHPLSLYVIFAFLAVKFCPVSHPPRGQVEIHDGQPQTPFARVGLSENVRLRESGDRLSTGDGSWFFCMLTHIRYGYFQQHIRPHHLPDYCFFSSGYLYILGGKVCKRFLHFQGSDDRGWHLRGSFIRTEDWLFVVSYCVFCSIQATFSSRWNSDTLCFSCIHRPQHCVDCCDWMRAAMTSDTKHFIAKFVFRLSLFCVWFTFVSFLTTASCIALSQWLIHTDQVRTLVECHVFLRKLLFGGIGVVWILLQVFFGFLLPRLILIRMVRHDNDAG